MSRLRASTKPSSPIADSNEVERHRLAMIGGLTAGLGHDIRNAVMPALLRADALSASPDLSDSARRDIDAIRLSILGLQRLATGLRLLSQDGGEAAVATQLPEWWRDAGPLIAASLGAGTQLDVDIPDALPPTSVPPNLIAQVTLALTMNARIWMQGSATPRVSLKARETPECIYLTVQFSGRIRAFKPWAPESLLALPRNTPIENLAGLELERVREMLVGYNGDLQLDELSDDSGSFTLKMPILKSAQRKVTSNATLVRLELNDPRQLAVARLILAQRGFAEWSEQASYSREPEMIVCDRGSFAAARERIATDHASIPQRMIVVGEPESISEQDEVTWISPSRIGTLADALR